jgi:hypothetical protein
MLMLLEYHLRDRIIIKECPQDEINRLEVAYMMGCFVKDKDIKGKFLIKGQINNKIILQEHYDK